MSSTNASAKTFCIRPDYVPHQHAATVEQSFGEYWQPWRIAESMLYQYHVYQAARELCDRHALQTVADFGCGVGTKLDHFLGHLHPTAFDQPTVADYIAETFPRLTFRPIDLQHPHDALDPAERFDLTICADVVEHLLDPDPAMELLRAHTGRFCVLSTPERDIERGPDVLKATKPEHVREWNSDEFIRYVESCGFRIVEHRLLPKARLSDEDEAKRAAATEHTRDCHGCQMVVCTPA